MKNKKIPILLGILFLLGIPSIKSQDTPNFNHKIGATFISEHINIPFQKRLGEKKHFGTVINYEISKVRTRIYQFGHNFNLGYFLHKDFFRAYFVNYKPTFSFRFWKTLQFDLPVGLGYGHSFSTEQGYVFKDGAYQKAKSKGKPHFMPSLGLGITLKLNRLTKLPFEIFSQYEMFALTPYAPNGSLPFTVHTSLNFGVKYQLK